MNIAHLNKLNAVLLALGLLALAGCGGGGGSSPAAAPPVNAAPKAVLALAADAATPTLGVEVALSALGSSDPEGGALTYTWTLQSKPVDSALSLQAGNAATVKFVPDRMGTYVVRVRVADPAGLYAEQDLTVQVSNQLPVAVIDKTSATILAGGSVTVSAASSYDLDGDKLSYAWTLDSKPAGSTATIAQPNSSDLSLTPDLAGTYVAILKLSDGKSSLSTRVVLKALAQATGSVQLPFTPKAAAYSKAIDKAVLASDAPNALHIVDPFSGVIATVLMPAPYKSLALSADGKLAGVLHEGLLTLVDLTTTTVLHTSATGGSHTEVFLTNSGIAYLAGQTGGQWVTPPVTVINARTGEPVQQSEWMGSGGFFYGTMRGVYSEVNHKGYAVAAGLSPSDISYFTVDPAANKVLALGDSPYHGDYPIYSPLFLSNREDLVFTSAGNYFRADTLRYAGTLNLGTSLISLSQSPELETLALTGTPGSYPDYAVTYPSSYKRYTGELILFAGDLSLPLLDGQQSYARNIFHSAAGNHVALVQTGGAAQNASGLKFYLVYR
ncbi:PKD domain-containing protein [Rugamonas sp. A1-17]|nr:PKD domain-containing protein [Rugamonas sp. A1-17]